MNRLKKVSKALLCVSVSALVGMSNAYADGTAAGTNVKNTFTLNYQVLGVAQPTIDTGPTGSDNPTEFTVDRMIDLTVASSGNKTVAPGALDQELVFSVTNDGNDLQAYDFALVNETGDDFNASGLAITVYVDDGDNTCDGTDTAGVGTAYTPGSGNASVDVAADATLCIVVDGDIASGQTDTQTSEVSLVADTLEPSTVGSAGDKVIADAGTNTLTGVAENVLGDGHGGAGNNDNDNEGDHSATGTYIVASANLTASKSVGIFTQDGTGCSSIPGTAGGGDQYSIPGACVEYIISIANNGATLAATNVTVSDVLPSDLEYVTAAKSVGLTGGSFSQPATGTDCTGGACTVALTGSTLAAGVTGTITIRAKVK